MSKTGAAAAASSAHAAAAISVERTAALHPIARARPRPIDLSFIVIGVHLLRWPVAARSNHSATMPGRRCPIESPGMWPGRGFAGRIGHGGRVPPAAYGASACCVVRQCSPTLCAPRRDPSCTARVAGSSRYPDYPSGAGRARLRDLPVAAAMPLPRGVTVYQRGAGRPTGRRSWRLLEADAKPCEDAVVARVAHHRHGRGAGVIELDHHM